MPRRRDGSWSGHPVTLRRCETISWAAAGSSAASAGSRGGSGGRLTPAGVTMRFTKMHGLGNDYVYVDCFSQPPPRQPAELARRVSDRHFGIGSDGLILICPSERADARMRMFNADGSEGEMCGNGIRCV